MQVTGKQASNEIVLSAVNAFCEHTIGVTAADVLASDQECMDVLFNQYHGSDFTSGAQFQAFVAQQLTTTQPLHPRILCACTRAQITLITFSTEAKNAYTLTTKRYPSIFPPEAKTAGKDSVPVVDAVLLHLICGKQHRYQRLYRPDVPAENVLVMDSLTCATRLELISVLAVSYNAQVKQARVRCSV